MNKPVPGFEDFLKTIFHQENPETKTDVFPTTFEKWLPEIDVNQWIEIGESYKRHILGPPLDIREFPHEILDHFIDWCNEPDARKRDADDTELFYEFVKENYPSYY